MKQSSELSRAELKPKAMPPVEPGQALLLLAEIIADAEEIGADTIAAKADAIIRGAIATRGVEILEPTPEQMQRIVSALDERTVLSVAQ